MRYPAPRFLDQGDAALTVEFGDSVDPEINAQVLALDRAFLTEAPVGVRETTPSYRSLLIHYEPLEISKAALIDWIDARRAAPQPRAAPASRLWVVPCCYDPALAQDILEAAALLELTAQSLARTHAGGDYLAYMYGFAPGWCYLGGLAPALALPRRPHPRGPTPEGAVLIGGGLSLVATNPMPTGWYVVGRTPERLFSLTRAPNFLIAPGDRLRFDAGRRIDILGARCARRCWRDRRTRGARGVSARLLIRAAGPGVTVQDAGRFGYSRFGVTPAGPMDSAAFLTATRAAGAVAAIEVSLGGAVFEAEGATLAVAVAGGDFALRLDDAPLPSACLIPLAPGARLSIRPGAGGAWSYVAVGARLDLPLTLGSLSTHARSALGPKPLAAGDALTLDALLPAPDGVAALHAPWLRTSDAPIRVVPGPQDDYFTPDAVAAFLSTRWRVGVRSDRMAFALEGPPLRHARGHDIVSDGAAMGAVQVPGSGLPFVLMADRQPTGGYPKIATVIGADLGRFAQLRPGASVRFEATSWPQAVAARAALRAELDKVTRVKIEAAVTAEALLENNLIGGVIDARD